MERETKQKGFKEFCAEYLAAWAEYKLNQDIATDLLYTCPPKRREAAKKRRNAGRKMGRLKKRFKAEGWELPKSRRGRPKYR
jgi:hypothetical protein